MSSEEHQPVIDETVPRLSQSDLISAAAAVLVLVILSWWWHSDSIHGYFVLKDLRDYATVVRKAELSVGEKERLIRVIHAIEDNVRDGNCPTHWNHTDDAVREMLADKITSEEVKLLMLELDRARANLR